MVSLTSVTPSQLFPFHVHLPAEVLGKPGVMLCEQMKTVSLDRWTPSRWRSARRTSWRQVDEALRSSLSL